mgnify:CR=1 FL=1
MVTDKLERLRRNLLRSYIHVSRGIGIIAAMFPVAVYLSGRAFGISLQDSLSHYFFASSNGLNDPFDHPVRILFVGGLFAIGTFLFLYKGFSRGENALLNLAGVLAIGVAVLPMGMWQVARFFTPHAACAVSLFLCIIYIAIWGRRDSVNLLRKEARISFYVTTYNIIAALMGSFIVLAVVLNFLFGTRTSIIFWVESAGIWVFATFWLVKAMELGELIEQEDRAGTLHRQPVAL